VKSSEQGAAAVWGANEADLTEYSARHVVERWHGTVVMAPPTE
jgi:hypothetical protein